MIGPLLQLREYHPYLLCGEGDDLATGASSGCPRRFVCSNYSFSSHSSYIMVLWLQYSRDLVQMCTCAFGENCCAGRLTMGLCSLPFSGAQFAGNVELVVPRNLMHGALIVDVCDG